MRKIILHFYFASQQAGQLRSALGKTQMVLGDELESMEAVLVELGYLKRDGPGSAGLSVTEKGRLACQLNAANELVLSECVFQNVFEGVDAAVFAGLVCSLVGDARSEFQV